MTKVLILGKTGLLGSEFTRVKPADMEVIEAGREIPIDDEASLSKKLDGLSPEWVVNCVSYNKVDAAEKEGREEARLVNEAFPEILGRVTSEKKIPLIHFSTDYVYGPGNSQPRMETEAPHPLGVYAKSKAGGEKGALINPLAYVVRVTSLYGLQRSNHAVWVMNAIETGKPASIVSDLACSPSYTRDLARWIFDLIRKNPEAGIYNLCHKGGTSRFGFAEMLCEAAGASKPYPLKEAKVADLNMPAPRPLDVVMSTDKWEKLIGPIKTLREGADAFVADWKREKNP